VCAGATGKKKKLRRTDSNEIAVKWLSQFEHRVDTAIKRDEQESESLEAALAED